ncbi:substrate-binding domain-containing protein [Bacillus sp. B15-48]|uniref:LacI family DNA-binding transcriptional regulator n=1 Tax=Bacillus sp. B15-48 TaxID=1548601 RepID=UPI00193FDE74|nr:substrate-binding domain-containing protein [Bacillus sp. B15-48]MBM4761257.1 substrate-binding domain-containing protein [Bacillus sp. B15-48]
MRKVTMKDVAAKAEVSKSTVSQYINGRYEYMAQATKERIENAIKELGYIPNYVAKSLKQKKSATIGVIVANIMHSFTTEIIRVIEDTCKQNDFHIFVCNADDDPAKERSYINMLMAKQVDGLLIFPTSGNTEIYKKLKKSQFPVVFIDRKMEPIIYPTVLLDNEKASELVVECFLKSGKTKICLVAQSIESGITPRLERIEGYKKALLKNGLPVNEKWIITADSPEMNKQLLSLWQDQANRPNAFYAINGMAAIELVTFLKAQHILVPRDVSVITMDDSPFLAASTPAITVVAQPTHEMGKDAANLILELINHEELKEEYQILRYPPILIERESV